MPQSKHAEPDTDPTALWRQWYESLIQTESIVAGDSESRGSFIEVASRFFESYADQYQMARQACETQLHHLQIPTRSDIARVAGLVVALEDKVDQLADAFDAAVDERAQPATEDVLSALGERISRIEKRLETLLGAVENLDAKLGVKPDANRRTSSKPTPDGNQPPRHAPGSHTRRTAHNAEDQVAV